MRGVIAMSLLSVGCVACGGARSASTGTTEGSEAESKRPPRPEEVADLMIFPRVMQVGDEVFPVPHESAVRKIAPIGPAMRRHLGLPEFPENTDATYTLRIDPRAKGAEITSAFQSLAFTGLPRARVLPHGVILRAVVPSPPGSPEGASEQGRLPDRPLIVHVGENAIELWRSGSVEQESRKTVASFVESGSVDSPELQRERTVGDSEEPSKQLATIPSPDVDVVLASLREHCSTNAPCNPFAIHMTPEAPGASVLAVFEAVFAWPGFTAGSRHGPVAVVYSRDVRRGGAVFGAQVVNGRIPAEKIREIVRANFGKFRKCYEAGLRRDRELSGQVGVRFVIGRDGKVSNVGVDASSTMPDEAVSACVVRGFYELEFPWPEGGIVTVTYPLQFSPK